MRCCPFFVVIIFFSFLVCLFVATAAWLSRITNLRSDALDALHLRRYCCRRMLLTHVDLIEKLYVDLTHLFFFFSSI